MEWNVTVTTNAATWSTSSDAIVWTTSAPVAPTQMNTGAIEDYLVDVSKPAQGNPKGTPGGIDEALAGKPLDEQIKIINDLDRVVDNTNRNPNFMDAWSLQRDIQNQQEQQPADQWQQSPEPESKPDESSLESRIAALEKAQQEKVAEEQRIEAEKNPDNWEEISYEEWQQHWNEFQQAQQDLQELTQKYGETYKNNLALSWENDILKSTIGSLQNELKDTKSKLAYLESTANIVNDATETKLLNLRRSAAENPWWAAELNYLNFLQHERQNLTGQDLSQNINDLYFQRVQKQARPEAVDYEVPNTTQTGNPELNKQSGGNETPNPGSLEDYLI